MIELPRPRALIFDWDNTLVDTWPIIHSALNDTFRESGMEEWTLEDTMRRVAKSMRDSFPVLFGEEWQEAGERYRKHYRSRHLGSLRPLPGAQGVLDAARAFGLPCFLVSNKLGPSLREEVAHLGWNNYFSGITGADDAARDKPHPDPVHLALRESGFSPGAELWFIGDSEVDLACAEAVGCTGVLYGDHAASHEAYTLTHFHGYPFHAHARGHADMLMLLTRAMRGEDAA